MKTPRVEIMGHNKGQTRPIYSLAGRHRPLNFISNIVLNGLLVEKWLAIVKDVMRIFSMTDTNKI